MKRNKVYCGDARRILNTWPAECVDMVITSPPYYQVRHYKSPPQIWGGIEGCSHEWMDVIRRPNGGKGTNANVGANRNTEANMRDGNLLSATCKKCGAWKGELGLETDWDAYIHDLCDIFDHVKWVLKDSGSVYVIIGDTYNTNHGGGNAGKVNPEQTEQILACQERTSDKLPTSCLVGIPMRFAIEMMNRGWILKNTIIWHKCLSEKTRLWVRTQKGTMPAEIRDLARLDPSTIELWTGEKWSKVRRMDFNKVGGGIKLMLRNGEEIIATNEHRWPTQRGLLRTDELFEGDVLDGCQLSPRIEDETVYLADDIGWLVGLYLAEGSHDKSGIQIACHKDELDKQFKRIKSICDDYGTKCAAFELDGNQATISIYGKIIPAIIDTYITGNNAKTKHLTTAAWQRDDFWLGCVLDGYLEGDGHWDKKNQRWRLSFTRNDRLAEDLRIICSKWEYNIKLQRKISKIGDKEYPAYGGEIRTGESQHHNCKDDREIVKVEQSHATNYYDIEIEDKPHLFATASGTLTHNSNAMPSSVSNRYTPDFEYVFFFVKSNSIRYYVNSRMKRIQKMKPTGLKGIEGEDWDWFPCPTCQQGEKEDTDHKQDSVIDPVTGKPKAQYEGFNTRYKQTKIPEDTAESYGSPRARYHRKCKNKNCVDGWVKRTLWKSHKYYFDQQREPALTPGSKHVHTNAADEFAVRAPIETDIERNKRTVWTIPTQPSPLKHYAVFPEALLETPIKASCPEMVCSKCGLPIVPVYERVPIGDKSLVGQLYGGDKNGQYHGQAQKDYDEHRAQNPSDTKRRILESLANPKVQTGTASCSHVRGGDAQEEQRKKYGAHPFRKDACTIPQGSVYQDPKVRVKDAACQCYTDTVPGIVLDPFFGSGTTGLVARRLGRDWVGIDVKPGYVQMARERLGVTPPVAHHPRIHKGQKRLLL